MVETTCAKSAKDCCNTNVTCKPNGLGTARLKKVHQKDNQNRLQHLRYHLQLPLVTSGKRKVWTVPWELVAAQSGMVSSPTTEQLLEWDLGCSDCFWLHQANYFPVGPWERARQSPEVGRKYLSLPNFLVDSFSEAKRTPNYNLIQATFVRALNKFTYLCTQRDKTFARNNGLGFDATDFISKQRHVNVAETTSHSSKVRELCGFRPLVQLGSP